MGNSGARSEGKRLGHLEDNSGGMRHNSPLQAAKAPPPPPPLLTDLVVPPLADGDPRPGVTEHEQLGGQQWVVVALKLQPAAGKALRRRLGLLVEQRGGQGGFVHLRWGGTGKRGVGIWDSFPKELIKMAST